MKFQFSFLIALFVCFGASAYGNNGYNNNRGNYNNNSSYRNYNGNSGYGGGGYSRGNYNNQGNYNRRNNQQRKKSGCKAGQKDGKKYLHGWNKSKSRGYITFIASPYRKTDTYTSNTGRVWETWVITITQGINKETLPALYEVATGRLICKDLGMVANPKTDYFGTMFRK